MSTSCGSVAEATEPRAAIAAVARMSRFTCYSLKLTSMLPRPSCQVVCLSSQDDFARLHRGVRIPILGKLEAVSGLLDKVMPVFQL